MGTSDSPPKDPGIFATSRSRNSDCFAGLDALKKEINLLQLSTSARHPTHPEIKRTSNSRTCLLDLPRELILEVIELLLGDDRYGGYDGEETTTDYPNFHRFDVWKDVANLAATCKHLYAQTMPKLYREDVKENYCSALLLSAKNGNTSAVSWSLGQGADVQIRDHTEPELTYGDYGPDQSASRRWFRTDMTALHWAAYHCHVDVLGLLLHAGANIHSRAKPFEFITGRRCQIYFRVMSIFEMHLLADRSFRTDVLDSSIRTGANAMYFALMEEYNETLDSEKEDYDEGRLAQRHGSRIDTVKGLNEAGVSLITHIGLGLHALHQACGNWDCDMASFLLQLEGRQDNAMVRDGLGNTPLHYLAMCAPENDMQPEPVIQLLLRHGADINAVNSAGLTPLQLCFRIPPLSFEKTRRVHLAPAIALAEAGACLFPDIVMRLEQGPRLRWGARRYNESGSIPAVTERQDACDRTLPAISDRDMDMAEARSVHLGVYRLLQELRGEEVESEERHENIAAWTTDDWRSHWQSQFGFGRQTMF